MSGTNDRKTPLDSVAALLAERDELQRFKDYVHKRLDDAGVTVDPESIHKAEGCRIGGRLDELIGKRDDLLAACRVVARLSLPEITGVVHPVGSKEDRLRQAIVHAREAVAKAEGA
jgi:hypothetical protein